MATKVKVALLERERNVGEYRFSRERMTLTYDGMTAAVEMNPYYVTMNNSDRYEEYVKRNLVRMMEEEWSKPLRQALGIS